MKYIVTLTMAMFVLQAHAEEKRVCVQQRDAKTQKEKQVCKTVKIHKKLEGTKIPDGKK